MWLKRQGLPHKQISILTGVFTAAQTSFMRDYQRGRIEALNELSFHRLLSDLDGQRVTLEAYFVSIHGPAFNPRWTRLNRLAGPNPARSGCAF